MFSRSDGGEFLSLFGLRTVLLLFSTTFSILVVMMLLNIITVDDLIKIFNLSPDAANALRLIYDRVQEVTHNILDILNQLLNKLFSWAGVDVDVSKVKVDLHKPEVPPQK